MVLVIFFLGVLRNFFESSLSIFFFENILCKTFGILFIYALRNSVGKNFEEFFGNFFEDFQQKEFTKISFAIPIISLIIFFANSSVMVLKADA